MIDTRHQPVLALFFQANLGPREQAQPGSGYAWLAEFWLIPDAEQTATVAAWAETQKAAVRASADQHVAALDELVSAAVPPGPVENGNRATRRAAAKKSGRVVKARGVPHSR